MTTEKTTKNEVEVVEPTENFVSVLQRETSDYVIYKDENNKFVRKAKYKNFTSFTAVSREDKLWWLNVLEADEDSDTGMKNHVGKEFEVEHIILNTYDKINEDTGQTEYGVLSYLINPEKKVLVTSSKSVYFSLIRIMELFGTPNDSDWENIKLKITSKKMTNGTQINIKMIG